MSVPSPVFADAVQAFNAGQIGPAAEMCRVLLQREPRHVDALGLLGIVALRRSEYEEAAALFGRAVAERPSSAALLVYRGLAFAGGGHDDLAADAFTQAIRIEPGNAEARHQLGNMLKRGRRFAEAVVQLGEAVKIEPRNSTIWLNLGVAQLELGATGEAVSSFRRALEISPAMVEGHNILGAALMEQGEISAAQQAFTTALQLRPNYAAAHNNLARTFRAQGRLREAVAEYRTALAIAPDPGTHSNLCYALNFIAGVSPDEIWNEHQAWSQRWGRAAAMEGGAPTATPNGGGGAAALNVASVHDRPAHHAKGGAAEPGQRLRVGFVSPDMVNHAVAYFFEPLLTGRDRHAWEAICYSDAKVPDRVTDRLRGLSDQWRDTGMLRDEELEAQIRRDAIDILVDLAGHTAHNRLRVFTRKAAPVQMTWLGYPNTTGLGAIDYRITDSISDPSGQTERWHAEKLLRLPRAFLCYQAPVDAPPCGVLPAKTAGRVTFASFSNFAKVSEPCLKVWATILQNVPDSRLILKSRGLGDVDTAARIHAQFQAHGVASGRVILDGTLVSVAEHLRQYNAVDIALDPFPYSGTTTTCEALWMGVPVVTLAGATHVARVGASLLTHLGHPEWIASTADEYISHAVSLAKAPDTLSDIRQNLRAEMQRSPLCDAAGFAADFTAALRQAWNSTEAFGH